MEKIFKSIALASLGLAILFSCTKNEPVAGTADGNGQMKLSVTGVLGEYKAAEGTKASLVNTLRVGWNGNETVHVFQQSDGKYLGSLTSSVTASGASVATLSGFINFGTGTLVFVYTNATVPTLTPGTKYTSLDISLAEQEADIPFVVYGTADSPRTTNVSGLVVNFSFATSVVSTYAAGLPAGKPVTKATLDSINTKCVLTIPSSGDITASGSTPGTITKTGGISSTNEQGQVLFGIAVPKSDAASDDRSLNFTVDSKAYTTSFSGVSIESGRAYSAMVVNHSIEGVALNKTSTKITPGSTETLTATVYPLQSRQIVTWKSSDETIATVNENGKVTGVTEGTVTITATSPDNTLIKGTCTVTIAVECVEMGGLRWAICNIGADKPTDKGWYFSWGNTEGYINVGQKKWVKASDGTTLLGSDGKFSEENYANTTGCNLKGNIAPESGNDVARVILGGKWRMPTKDEFMALYNACGGTGTYMTLPELSSATPGRGIYKVTKTQNYISYNGVAGLLFVDEAGHKLFFPAAGFGQDMNLFDEGYSGYYWSSTFENVNSGVYHLLFNSQIVPQKVVGNPYYFGYPVRPVSGL